MSQLRLWIIIAIFVAVNMLLLFLADGAARYEVDTEDFYSVARALASHGAFVDNENPAAYAVFRQPGYPVVLFLAEAIVGDDPSGLIVTLQVLAVLLIGVLVRSIAGLWIPGREDLAFALIVLNPNIIGTAHTLLPMTFYSLAFAAAIWAALSFSTRPSLQNALLVGLFSGIALLFRGDMKYLVYLFPVALPLLAWLGRARFNWRVALGGAIALVMALLVVSPWIVQNNIATGKVSISAGGVAALFIASNAALLEKRLYPNLSLDEARARVTTRGDEYLRDRAPVAPDGKRQSSLTKFYLGEIYSYPMRVLTAAAISSQVNLFASGGAQNVTRLLSQDVIESHSVFVQSGRGDRVLTFLSVLFDGSKVSVLLTIVAIAFAVVARVLGLAGFVAMARRQQWPILFMTVTIIGYGVAVVLFNGLSRYRIPLEPMLAILAVYGFDSLVLGSRQLRVNPRGFARKKRLERLE